jgi:hypothetical protein
MADMADRAGADVLASPSTARVWARIRGLLLAPAQEWKIIDAERPEPRALVMRWALPFTLFFFLAQMVGSMAFPPRVGGVASAPSSLQAIATVLVGSTFMLAGVWVIAWLVDWLAPKFGGRRDFNAALKVVVYAATGFWLSGVFGLAPPVAFLGVTCIVSFYTLWRGLPIVMKTDADKSLPFAAAVVAAGAVIGVVLMTLSGCFAFAGKQVSPSAPAAVAVAPTPAPAPRADPAAPLDREKFRRILPEAIPGGWVRAGVTTHNGGSTGFTGPTLEAAYERGGQTLTVRFVDLGVGRAASMIADRKALAPPLEGERGVVRYAEDAAGFRLLEIDRETGRARQLWIVRNRVAVSVEGTGGVSSDELTQAAGLVDMERVDQVARGR